MRENSGNRVPIYDVPLLSKPSIQKAFTFNKINKGFKAYELYHFDRNAITQIAFAPSNVTDLPGGMQVIH